MKRYASIYIGTFEVTLKVYEVGREKTMKEIDSRKKSTAVFHDIYKDRNLSPETVDSLIDTLSDMLEAIAMYKVDKYLTCGSYSLKSAMNILFVLDQIKMRLGIDVWILSNSEQRSMTYRVFANSEGFNHITKDCAVLADIGGYSLQLTLFVDGKIQTTQHILLGVADVREYVSRLSSQTSFREQISEMIAKEIEAFSNMYLKEHPVKNLILLNESTAGAIGIHKGNETSGSYDAKKFRDFLEKSLAENSFAVGSGRAEVPGRNEFFVPMLLMLSSIAAGIRSDKVCLPGNTINEGIAYHVASADRAVSVVHDFDTDVLSATEFIARRYGSYEPHLKVLDFLGMTILSTMKKRSGLTKRDILIYRVAAILHDCGKYISLSNSGENSYNIIVSSEILGLTHKEREMAAYVALFNRNDVIPYKDLANEFTEEEYVKIIKLLAVLRVTNALDRSHKQKFRKVKMNLRDNELVIQISADESIALEKGMFKSKADFFEHIFSIRPVIREKRAGEEGK